MADFVIVRHPDIKQPAEVPLSSLDHYRQKGWYPIDPEHQTAAEAVQQRVDELDGHAHWCQMLKPVPPGFMFDTFSCNCEGRL